MIQDDRLVEGNEVVYKAPEEEEWQLEKGTRKKNDGGWHTVQMGTKVKKEADTSNLIMCCELLVSLTYGAYTQRSGGDCTFIGGTGMSPTLLEYISNCL